MKKLVLLLVVCFALVQGVLIAEDSGIRFHDLYGQVTVRPDDEDDDLYEYAQLDTVLYYNDRIRTDVKSGAVLNFKDMSTFVIKEKTILVLPTPEASTSRMKIVAGNVWVNMKKMVEGGEFNVELTQAVAGIKGTVFSCGSYADYDRIVCGKGLVRVKNLHTGEEIDLHPGEEVRVSSRGSSKKSKIDLKKFEEEWKESLDKIGSSLNHSDLIDSANSRIAYMKTQRGELEEYFEELLTAEKVAENNIAKLRRLITTLTGETMEAGHLATQIKERIKAEDENKLELESLVIELSVTIDKMNAYVTKVQGEMADLTQSSSKKTEDKTTLNEEVAALSSELERELSYWENLKKDLSATSRRSQDWFETELSEANLKLETLIKLGEDLEVLQDEVFTSELRALSSRYKSCLSDTNNILKSLQIAKVDLGTIEILEDCEKDIADNLVIFDNQWSKYENIDRQSSDVQKRVLTQSLRIVGSFARIKRIYDRANRLQLSVIRNSGRQGIRTIEQEEVEEIWLRIRDQFARLSDSSAMLQERIDSLQNQINSGGIMGR